MTERVALGLACTLASLLSAGQGSAAEKAAPSEVAIAETSGVAPRARGTYVGLFATSFIGDGLRFNNPYRLATPLGDDAESIARTASYVDLGAAITLGDPRALQHGLAVRTSVALEGVRELGFTPSYLLYRRWRSLAAYGRLGIPMIITPTTNAGLEAAGGGVWFFRAGVGVAAEVIGDLFYGAGTREAARPAYPILSAQLGLVVAYEVLP